jgi:hypothetical protein
MDYPLGLFDVLFASLMTETQHTGNPNTQRLPDNVVHGFVSHLLFQ